jgi:hypothetical protein
VTSHNEQKTKAIKCGAFNYSIVVDVHRVTSMAVTDIDAVRKQKRAEYDTQYRLKRKLLLQQQASKDIQAVPGGKDLTSGECSLGQTIPI